MGSNGTNATLVWEEAELIQALTDEQTQLYAFTAISALIVWDCVLCLPREIELVWSRKMGPLAWLYLLSRYPFFIYVYASLYIETYLSYCTGILQWAEWMGRVATISNAGIQLARTHVVCGSKRWVLAVLLVPLVFGNVFGIVITAPVTCYNDGYGSREKLGNLVATISTFVLQTLLLGFTLRATLATVREQRSVSTFRHGSVASLIVQRGILYYILIFAITLIELVIFFKGSLYLQSLGDEFAVSLSILLLCRFTLNLRAKFVNNTNYSTTRTFQSRGSVASEIDFRSPPPNSGSWSKDMTNKVYAAFARDFADYESSGNSGQDEDFSNDADRSSRVLYIEHGSGNQEVSLQLARI